MGRPGAWGVCCALLTFAYSQHVQSTIFHEMHISMHGILSARVSCSASDIKVTTINLK